ncbi:MAG TPA: hypothetical protein VFV50_02030 [Bdellovibrionales bacterium]|nr:hypothetical protein [Bdellovibrionales bacterium]
MSEFMHNVQTRFKTSSASLVLYFFKLVTGLFLGLALSLMGQTIMGYGDLAFWFVLVMVAAVFLRVSKEWGAWGVVIFNLVVFLTGLLLRLYIQIAPGE